MDTSGNKPNINLKMKQDNNNKPDKVNYLNLYIGTYSGYILNITLDLSKNKKIKIDKSQTLKKICYKSSEQMIKTIHPFKDDYIFTSGIDEIIRIYDINNLQEKGLIMSYSGTISHLEIFDSKIFAICDNNVEVFNLKDFRKLNTFSEHKNGINAFLIHSSGKLMFTVGRDNYLMMWSLLSSNQTTNLPNNKKSKAKISNCKFRYKFSSTIEMINLLWLMKEKYLIVVFINKVLILDYNKKSENFEDWIVLEHKIKSTFDNPCKIISAKLVKERFLIIFKSNFEVEVIKIANKENEEKTILKDQSLCEFEINVKFCTLDAIDSKEKEGDNINVRLKLVDISCGKFVFISVISSNNEINIYDGTKMLKELFVENNNNYKVKNYKRLNLLTDRFTCISSNQVSKNTS